MAKDEVKAAALAPVLAEVNVVLDHLGMVLDHEEIVILLVHLLPAYCNRLDAISHVETVYDRHEELHPGAAIPASSLQALVDAGLRPAATPPPDITYARRALVALGLKLPASVHNEVSSVFGAMLDELEAARARAKG